MTGAINQFFDEYARVRNVEATWNIAGFSSTRTKLTSRNSAGDRISVGARQVTNLPEIVVGPGTRIHRKVDDFLDTFRKNKAVDVSELERILYRMAKVEGEAALDTFMLKLNGSLLNTTVSWKDTLRLSIDSIKDLKFKEEVIDLTEFKGNLEE